MKYQYRPVTDRRPDQQTIRERAEFLAHEIHHDRFAPEGELADAIAVEISRFARPEELRTRGGFRAVVEDRRGPLKTHRNGTTAYAWAVLRLACGHEVYNERLKNPRRPAPAFAKCRECAKGRA